MTIVEFLGLPRSGISTHALLLEKECERRGYSTQRVDDREFFPTMHTAVGDLRGVCIVHGAHLIESLYQHKGTDYLIFARGLTDSRMWLTMGYERGIIETTDLFRPYEAQTDYTILLETKPEVSKARHAKTKNHLAIDQEGLSDATLEHMSRIYERFKYSCDPKKTLCLPTNEPIDVLQKKVQEFVFQKPRLMR